MFILQYALFHYFVSLNIATLRLIKPFHNFFFVTFFASKLSIIINKDIEFSLAAESEAFAISSYQEDC